MRHLLNFPRLRELGSLNHLALLAFYAFLSLFTTYPLIFNFTTHAPGDVSDAPALTWNLWWIKFSIFDQFTNPLFTNYVFFLLK